MSEVAHQVIKADTASGRPSLVAKFAAKYSIEGNKLLSTLKATAFKQRGGQDVTNEQMAALLVVADQYQLNPFCKEIYAFPQDGGVVPIVGLDGWARIINSQAELNGLEFEDVGAVTERPTLKHACPEGIACIIHRKDRDKPTRVTEWYAECYRNTKPWNEMPRRMLRHKAMIQCARLAFALVGIYDEDEAQRILEGDVVVINTDGTPYSGGTASAVNDALKGRPAEDISDAEIVQPDAASNEGEKTDTASDAPADLELTAPQENSSEHLMQLVMDATGAEDLDYVSSMAREHLKGSALKSVLAAVTNKAEALKAE